MSYQEKTRIPRRQLAAGLASIAVQIYLVSMAAGCARETAPPPPADPADILVEPVQLALQAGGEAWLAVQANDASGQPIGGAVFRYEAADPRLLAVSAEGLVTSLGPATPETQLRVASGSRERVVTVSVTPGPPQRLEKLAGDGQQVTAGETPAAPLVIRVLDEWGNPLGGSPLTIRSASDLFPTGEAVTAADGTAHYAVPRLTRAGNAIVIIQAGADGPVESFQFPVLPGPPAEVTLEADAGGQAPPAGVSAALRLRVTDAFGNPVADVEVKARFDSPDTAPVEARSDSAGSVLLLIPPELSPGPATLELTLPASPEVSRSLAVVIPPHAPAASSRTDP